MFFEPTTKRNTADLAMVQKTIIDTPHRGSLLKGVDVQVLCTKHIKCKVDWKDEIGQENVLKQQGWPQAWEYCQAKLIQTLGRALQGVNWSWSQCIKSHHAQTSSGKGQPSLFWNRNIIRSILTGLRRKRTGLLFSGPKSSFQIKVHFAFHLEIKVPESGGRVERHRIHVAWSPVWSFHSQWWFGLLLSAGVGPLCFLKSTVNAAIYQERLEHFMLPSADKLYGDADFIFQQDLAPAHTAKGTKSWFNDRGVTVLDWPANTPDLNPIENDGILSKGKWETRWADELKAAIKETWASITPQQCHKLITFMPCWIEAVIKAKWASTKYRVHIQ